MLVKAMLWTNRVMWPPEKTTQEVAALDDLKHRTDQVSRLRGQANTGGVRKVKGKAEELNWKETEIR